MILARSYSGGVSGITCFIIVLSRRSSQLKKPYGEQPRTNLTPNLYAPAIRPFDKNQSYARLAKPATRQAAPAPGRRRRQKTKTGVGSTSAPLGHLPRCVPARPGPLEIEAAKGTGHVHHLADEEQARHCLCLHRFRRQAIGIDAAESYFGLVVAQRAGGFHLSLIH